MVAAQQQEITVHLNQGDVLHRAAENVGHVGATAPFGVYPTSDGHLALAMMPCPALGKILGVDWLDEFETNKAMYESRDKIHRMLAAHFQRDTTKNWINLLDSHDVWCAPVQDYSDLENDPQVKHNNLLWTVPVGSDGGAFRTVGTPFRFSATQVELRYGVPRAGAHNKELLAEFGLPEAP
jgi:crotonobetainyl-CoA:carnitine CoA-transferase CaiB-like acyl-CoA transferase